MVRLVFLNGDQRNFQKVGATWDVTLEVHEDGLLGFEVILNLSDGDHDLLVVPSNIKWSDVSVICFPYCEWGSVWENEIEVLKLIAALDTSGHSSFIMHFLQGICGLTLS